LGHANRLLPRVRWRALEIEAHGPVDLGLAAASVVFNRYQY